MEGRESVLVRGDARPEPSLRFAAVLREVSESCLGICISDILVKLAPGQTMKNNNAALRSQGSIR